MIEQPLHPTVDASGMTNHHDQDSKSHLADAEAPVFGASLVAAHRANDSDAALWRVLAAVAVAVVVTAIKVVILMR